MTTRRSKASAARSVLRPVRPSRRTGSAKCAWARQSRPTRCSSARASRPCSSPRAGSPTSSASATRHRPKLFALKIELPDMLYARVIEADERVTAEGDILRPLDEEKLRRDLEKAHADGIAACAILFMHGYRHPAHEARAAEIAREAGFTQVSTSHETVRAAEIRLARRYDRGRRLSLAGACAATPRGSRARWARARACSS